MELRNMDSILSAVSGIQPTYTMCTWGHVPRKGDVLKHFEDVLRTYRSRFQIEFCFRDAKQFTGLTHCQARHKNQLDFSYNASFASQNVAKVMMKENGLPYSMASFKELMASTYIAKLIFDKCRNMPNRKLISHTIKELFGWQRKAA